MISQGQTVNKQSNVGNLAVEATPVACKSHSKASVLVVTTRV